MAEGAKSVYDALQEDNDEKLSAYEQNGGLVEELGGKQLDIITKLMTSRNYSFCTFNVEEAMEATPAGTSLTKIVAAGALAGAFLGICIVALLDFIKKPIKGRRDIESSCSYPAIDSSIGKGADLLWANVRFALNDTPKTVAIVPACAANVRSLGERLSCAMQRLDEKASVREVSADLDAPGHFAGEESTVVLVCPPLAEGLEELGRLANPMQQWYVFRNGLIPACSLRTQFVSLIWLGPRWLALFFLVSCFFRQCRQNVSPHRGRLLLREEAV